MNHTLNYTAHVIDAIGAIRSNYRKKGLDYDAATLVAWADMLRRSVKYVLPPNGHYISAGKGLPEGLLPQRLPFPLITLEVPYPESFDVTSPDEAQSTRRLIMAQELNLIPFAGGFQVDNEPLSPEGFMISIFCYVDKARQWIPQHSGAYIRYDVPVAPASAATYPKDTSSAQSVYPFISVPVLRDQYTRMVAQYGTAITQRAIATDTATEVRIAYEFLQVLACRNVEQREHQPSVELNRSRRKKGKEPFDVFRTLRVGDVMIGRPVGFNPNDNTGFKVREHLRSGHIRRLASGSIWIEDTVVAAGSACGKVEKEYRIPSDIRISGMPRQTT